MLNSPVLVVLAAGMGSRYGGLKQIDKMDDYGNTLINFSLYDAKKAGFNDVLFIIRKDIEKDFSEVMGNRLGAFEHVEFAYQELDALPTWIKKPEGRIKPFGTTHALWCARKQLKGKQFVTINADDFYGYGSYKLAYDFLSKNKADNVHAIIGYELMKTLSPVGFVSRGVCLTDKNGILTKIDERKKIKLEDGAAYFTLDYGETFTRIPDGLTASMNMWAFNSGFMDNVSRTFTRRLDKGFKVRPDKFEETITEAVEHVMPKSVIHVIPTNETWFGVTYKEDKPAVKASIEELIRQGKYPAKQL